MAAAAGYRYTAPVRVRSWQPDRPAAEQLDELLAEASRPGFLVVRFAAGDDDSSSGELPWRALEAWISSRAVTVADVAGALTAPALALALCCDLVVVRVGATLELGMAGGPPPPPAVVWALRRAGSGALARGLLAGGSVTAAEAVALGLAHDSVADEDPLPLPAPVSDAALTAARDLLRARSGRGPAAALELATFRLLFAAGDPEEGARAFLEKRDADFESGNC